MWIFCVCLKKPKLRAMVPVEAVGAEKSPGIKNGGLLNIIYHELEVKCFANQIPEHITVDVSQLNIGQSIHLDEIKFPAGIEVTMHDKTCNGYQYRNAISDARQGRRRPDSSAAVAAEVVAIKQKTPEALALKPQRPLRLRPRTRRRNSMWLVVGLGNPGTEYRGHRHNIGFYGGRGNLCRLFFFSADKKISRVTPRQVEIADQKSLILLPLTYMNDSGKAVQACLCVS